MAIFSKTCEYGIKAVLFIAHTGVQGRKVGIKEIAAGIDSPEFFLAKILQNISRKGIVNSFKGPNGGFYITDESLKRPISDIVEAIDGDGLFRGCALGLKQCSEINPCPLHEEFKVIRTRIYDMLHTINIDQFNQELMSGMLSLKK
ncbi:Rrf2 family transcriptional regulator [Mucilaginibacter terrenus]|uniref:Rrf2 family transcriptional regulator n=1 Tax=Mucilaginibacter terrenus TaxID=2482727 RepID=A0A3E2NVW4_9SPHI|nr:Rrf2 family transcriptional regulator [Mucilaginibacter terrenus]RFZ85158.1 Rrf2 family transcriptional regulator [Mucilaginibacter terrenus]